MNELLNLRLDLDEAITYGDFDKAKKLVKDGLTLAHREENLGEMEYFKGQIEILNENFRKAIDLLKPEYSDIKKQLVKHIKELKHYEKTG